MWIEVLLTLGAAYWIKRKWTKNNPKPNAIVVFGANPIMDSERVEMFMFDATDDEQLNYYNRELYKVNRSDPWSFVKHEYLNSFGQHCETVAVFELHDSVWGKPDRIGFDDLGRMLYYSRNVTHRDFRY